ncbi:MAG TPA: PD-(D/E)XK nuclease family protein [Gammaproteobacteria bacterium]
MSVHIHPYSEDLLAQAAQQILRHAAPPDLSGIVVLMADTLHAPVLQQQVIRQAQQHGHAAVLGLRVTTLRDWIETSAPDSGTPLGDPARQLLLVEALRQHSGLFGEDDPWRVADSLLELFDELSRFRTPLPASAAELAERMARGYGIAGTPPAPLTREAFIVHRLWQAWQEQTAAREQIDPWNHYLHKLLQRMPQSSAEPHYLLIGLQADTPLEREWITARLRAGRADWLLHGAGDGSGTGEGVLQEILALDARPQFTAQQGPQARSRFLDGVYPHDGENMRQRAARLAAAFPDSPLQGQLATLAADSAEQEARAIDVQVRRWLLEGKRRIGIVTEDRRLARRVRALLERAGIVLADAGGWALSTTSAAACLERWLQTVEEDFAHQPLLDFLKSPFLSTAEQRSAHLSCVYRLEHDVILHENIARGLDRYRRNLAYRRQRLNWPPTVVEPLAALLDRLETAARPLTRLLLRSHPPRLYLEQLRDSLTILGVWNAFDTDAAGQCLLRLWEELDSAAQQAPMVIGWQEFRIWLGHTLENRNFRPSLSDGPVQLLNLQQSQLLSFDAVLVGGCDREHLPGKDRATAFFNSGVRRELGLPIWERRLAERLYQFRHLLECAPRILLTWRREDQGEPHLPSPWLEALETLHRLTYQRGLEDSALKTLLRSEQADIAPPEPAPRPEPPQLPRPSIPAALLPDSVTASNHQHLIDCPYRYFASDCLRLSPPEAVRELLQKSDYGERVHRCLEAFHSDVQGLPGPFLQSLDTATRAAAIDLLQHIAQAVFARDLEDNFQHRGWLKRWLQLIPAYVDWQIQRAQSWQVADVEARVQRDLNAQLRLEGRLDRIDSAGAARAVVDYKTGAVPRQADIDAGEAVQLPIYALLCAIPVTQVDYVQLMGTRVKCAGGLEGEALHTLRDDVGRRIETLHAAIAAGQPLPAWGDPDSCRHCPMDGLCRRAVWIDSEHTSPA